MTLQEAIDNAPGWARWLGVDDCGCYGAFYEVKPKRNDHGYEKISAQENKIVIDDCIEGPKLIEVNK